MPGCICSSAANEARLQNLNLLPMVLIVANCVSWMAYSFIIDNWLLFVPNFAGFLIGLFLFLLTYGIGVPSLRERDRITGAALVLATVLPMLAAVERLILDDECSRKTLWGIAGVLPLANVPFQCPAYLSAGRMWTGCRLRLLDAFPVLDTFSREVAA